MRNMILACCVATALVGCGPDGGGSNVPPPVPVSSVNGAAADGLISHGTIRIYDFSNGTRGALLAETVTDDEGLYELELQTESKPIMVEVTEGNYLEEATGKTVALDPVENENLTALMNHVAGESVTIAVTPFTHVAAALARYSIAAGNNVVGAIDDANHRVTQWIGLPIVSTIPLDITQSSNVSASVTPAHFYGFLSGAISFWTQAHYTNNQDVSANGCAEYEQCSIDFIQTMYSDVLADGMLDGVGANNISLSFGTTALSPSVYRAELALGVLDISDLRPGNGSYGNNTGLTSTQLLLRSRAYAASTDALFGGVPPESIDTPVIALDSHANGAWVRATQNVTGTVVDQIGPGNVTLTVDGNVVGSAAANYYAPSIPWSSTSVSDGQHTVALIVTNGAGLTATAMANVNVDNTKPTLVFTSVAEGDKCRISGNVSDGSNINLTSAVVSQNTYESIPYSQTIYRGSNSATYANFDSLLTAFRASIPLTLKTTSTSSITVSLVNNYASFLVNKGPQSVEVADAAGNKTLLATGGNTGTTKLTCGGYIYGSFYATGCTGVNPEAYIVTVDGPSPACSSPVVTN